jgi:hypothetical protein
MLRLFGFLAPRFCLPCLGSLVFLLPDFGCHVEALWFSCSQILAVLLRPFGFLAPTFCLSYLGSRFLAPKFCLPCLGSLVFLLPDFGCPVEVLWFSCSQILAILLRPFGFLAPRFCLPCLGPLVFLLPDFVYPV